jgi:hypothetical protein
MAFFQFRQNNSGGEYHIEDNIGHTVWIEATDSNEANNKASSIGLFSLSYCDCCGERFYSTWDGDAEEAWTVEENKGWHRERYGELVTIIHHADGRVQREVR